MVTKKLMAGALAGFLMIGASAPTWANPPASGANVATRTPAQADGADRSLLGMLAPMLTDPAQHPPQKTCKPGDLYSAHDVVGDPEACFMGRLNVPNGAAGAAGNVGGY